MAVSTNLGLYLPTREDYISVKRDLSDNYEIIDESAGMLEKGIAIVVDGDTAPQAISSGDYLFIKNHSSLATGGYHATANIANGAAVTSSNTAADSKGVTNAIKEDIENVIKYQDTNLVYLNDLTWTQTSGGEYQAEIPLPTGVTISGTVIGIMIQRIQSIATDYYIMPFSNQGVPSVMANRNTFNAGTRMQFRILYIPS